ncbi:hypothetical protein DVQ84_18770 [Yersinia enterocolitica]|nr:hypothetical protein [Yersinia enterocolitica]EKN6033458.1 hypothetical protein [Yersinia enterocolitica]EKN6071654.1 hypothetical protein [Yersinia enterocolitica]EKN6191093.1 hypothetical protein [Yersinia enterocolitica]EKN6220303.1 hypothetical protein [Yersinia enterocolitica]
MRLLTKSPQRRKQVDHKDAVLLLLKQASLMARAAPSLARTLYSSTCLHLTISSRRGLSAV